ncbi:hypothetical protein [Streptomyces sp. NBC_01614]|uniref:Transposase n=1 Tax=Streptomyces sp. NBC_00180 TaxID=2903632 RepID=A0AAU1IB31_9ACTN
MTGEAPAGTESVAADGKSAHGSRDGDAPTGHLLAAMTDDNRTVAQLNLFILCGKVKWAGQRRW